MYTVIHTQITHLYGAIAWFRPTVRPNTLTNDGLNWNGSHVKKLTPEKRCLATVCLPGGSTEWAGRFEANRQFVQYNTPYSLYSDRRPIPILFHTSFSYFFFFGSERFTHRELSMVKPSRSSDARCFEYNHLLAQNCASNK